MNLYMKALQKIFYILAASFVLVSCERTYDAPPLAEPKYEGPKANITIASLKQQFSSATQEAPALITTDLILKAYVSANDASGNIYKQIYLQDATGAIPILADYTGVYGLYRVGQEVFVNLKGLCISVYGGEQQIGIPSGNFFRLLQADFEKHVQLNGWPDKTKVEPKLITDISSINEDVAGMTFRLVRLEGVFFVNGGKASFATNTASGTEVLKDSHGNSIDVRTSNYAKFALETLPIGRGTVIAILGRFRGNWQLTIPTEKDFFDFDGIAPENNDNPTPGQPGGEVVLFSENFGTPVKEGTYWPSFKDYKGFNNPASMFEDTSGKASVRITNNYTNVWIPAGTSGAINIKGINTKGITKATLIYKVGANVYNAGESMDLNAMKVKCNGVELVIPGKVVTGDKKEGNIPFEMKIENVTVADNTNIEFISVAETNTFGLRLYEVKLLSVNASGGETIIPN
ncbi:DUF5689 domain-containing protein [Bacteroides pyogenes]|uniref:DUF5689 domain-containing protein n=1 Tax=Bacteroides pyogenes TaxID=310300 RepID=UPI001F3CE14F|nr:DUF5689 domain-containing protein [Bacteroides pyogenes]MCE9107287.1 hypothetical protein [Bacteroides pyogenes]